MHVIEEVSPAVAAFRFERGYPLPETIRKARDVSGL